MRQCAEPCAEKCGGISSKHFDFIDYFIAQCANAPKYCKTSALYRHFYISSFFTFFVKIERMGAIIKITCC